MTRRPAIRFIGIFAMLYFAACTARGPLEWVPQGTPDGTTVTIFEASNRTYTAVDPPERGRRPQTAFARHQLRVPDRHTPGSVAIPQGRANPARHFLLAASGTYPTREDFVRALRTELASLPPDQREISVFTPGFNMSEAQTLARTAQLTYDLRIPGITAVYSWPSAASILGYAYDRDSILFSRDGYEDYLRAIAESRPRRMILVAHSMGAHLTMEALRQIAIEDPGWIRRNVGGVVLISPDIDLDVFRSQVTRIGELPQPFAIFVSQEDRALALSATITGESQRLGSVTDPAVLSDLNIILLDVSVFSTGLGHFDFGRSPALLSIVEQMAQIELSFERDPAANTGLVAGTILTVQNATRIVLSPIVE